MGKKFLFNPIEGTFDTVWGYDEKLKRADNNVWETAQNGVEYYSPTQHGRIYGIIYRKYFDIPDSPGAGQITTIALGLTPNHVLSVGGYVVELTSGDKILIGSGSGNTASNMGMHIQVIGSNLEIDSNDSLDHQGGKCWIDYTK